MDQHIIGGKNGAHGGSSKNRFAYEWWSQWCIIRWCWNSIMLWCGIDMLVCVCVCPYAEVPVVVFLGVCVCVCMGVCTCAPVLHQDSVQKYKK